MTEHLRQGIRRLRWILPILALLLVPAVSPATPVWTQSTLTAHFVFETDVGSEGLAQRLAEIAEDKRGYLLGVLKISDDRVLTVRIASDDEDLSAIVGTDRPIRDWVAGLALSDRNLIVLSARGNEVFHATDTFVHELAHVYLDTATRGHRVPRWFHEGFAMLAASESVADRLRSAIGAAATGSYLPLQEIADSFPAEPPAVHLAYAQSMLFVRYLHRHGTGGGIGRVIEGVRTGLPFDLSVESAFGRTIPELWRGFERTIDPAASLLMFLTSTAVVWILVTGLFVFVYVKKRRRSAVKEEGWRLEEELAKLRRDPADDPEIQ